MGFDLASSLGNVGGWANKQVHQRMVQIALYGSIIFWILSSFRLIEEVNKILSSSFGLKVGKEGTRVVHSLIFGLFMYVGVRFILEPVFRRGGLVEGLSSRMTVDDILKRDMTVAELKKVVTLMEKEAKKAAVEANTDSTKKPEAKKPEAKNVNITANCMNTLQNIGKAVIDKPDTIPDNLMGKFRDNCHDLYNI